MLANGVTAIRTHADLTLANGLTSVEALIEVRERLRGLVDIQVVRARRAGRSIGPRGRRRSGRCCARRSTLGVDLVGGCPHLETDPHAANEQLPRRSPPRRACRSTCTPTRRSNPAMLALEDLAERVHRHGLPAPRHRQPLRQPRACSPRTASERWPSWSPTAGISVIALPHTNLFLQGREHQSRMPRALTAVTALRAAGVNVAAGADNLQDPFNPVGRGDPLETAGLMVMAAHLLPDEALATVTAAARVRLRAGTGRHRARGSRRPGRDARAHRARGDRHGSPAAVRDQCRRRRARHAVTSTRPSSHSKSQSRCAGHRAPSL